jgi:hypothetical protein
MKMKPDWDWSFVELMFLHNLEVISYCLFGKYILHILWISRMLLTQNLFLLLHNRMLFDWLTMFQLNISIIEYVDVAWHSGKHHRLLCRRLGFESCGLTGQALNLSSFWPQIIVVFMCFIFVICVTMSCHSCVIGAFEINKLFSIIITLSSLLYYVKIKQLVLFYTHKSYLINLPTLRKINKIQ